jgi:hypothetical protein
MAMFNTETRTRSARCPTHGLVTAEKKIPKLKFPFVVTGLWRRACRVATLPLPDVRRQGSIRGLHGSHLFGLKLVTLRSAKRERDGV